MLTTIQGLLNISFPWQIQAQEETAIISWRECSKKSVQSCPEPLEGKTAAILTRGAYREYVSTAKWRERRWRLFSTFPFSIPKIQLFLRATRRP